MAKAITQEQHDALHGIWPNNCCLCRLEEGNAALKARIEELEKRLEAAEEWIKVSVLVAQIRAFSGIEDETWRDVDWTQELPSGQYDIWQTLDQETKGRLAGKEKP